MLAPHEPALERVRPSACVDRNRIALRVPLVLHPLSLQIDQRGGRGEGRSLAPDAFAPSALALDATGDRVAWGTRDAIVIDGYASGADLKKLPNIRKNN